MNKFPDQIQDLDTITLGAGCFWCVEALFKEIGGVWRVISGYMGGTLENPSYESICGGNTGHAEVVQLQYDSSVVSLETILDWFWKSHDPTTLNRQGADVGTQYRSAIFYHIEAHRDIAIASKESAQVNYENPIVTEISGASEFYAAENYHQDYYAQNSGVPYCQMVIRPKLEKLGIRRA